MSALPPAVEVAALGPEELPPGRLSVAVFGPGSGEAVVLRLPDGRVGVVDGCVEDAERCPVRALLEALGSPEIAFLALTHPHDDHHKGLGALALAARAANPGMELWRPPLSARYLRTLAAIEALQAEATDGRAGGGQGRAAKPARGLQAWLDGVDAHTRADGGLRTFLPDRLLLGDPVRDPGGVVVWALGPADVEVDRAEQDLFQRVDRAVAEKRPAGARVAEGKGAQFDPNRVSGAVLVRWGGAGVLLGGDLLRSERPQAGWGPALRQLDGAPVQVVKVAHHGSAGAQDPAVWRGLLPELRLAVVTPFQGAAGRQPPQEPELEALRALGGGAPVWVTAPLAWRPAGPAPAARSHGAPAAPAEDGGGAVCVQLDRQGAVQGLFSTPGAWPLP
jgi:beta-lactamase superfamily II metal-dependent hydrolase